MSAEGCKPISTYCVVKECKNNSGNFSGSFFRFPKDVERSQTWARMCNRLDLVGSNTVFHNIRICSQHFEEEMFKVGKRKLLSPTAYPTIFPIHYDSMENTVSIPGTSKGYIAEGYSEDMYPFLPDPAELSEEEDLSDELLASSSEEVSRSTTPTPLSSPVGTQTPKSLSSESPRKKKYRKKIKSLTNRLNYLEQKVQMLENKPLEKDEGRKMFNDLCDKYLTPEQSAFTKIQASQKDRAMKGRRYTNEFKKMCLSMYFKGPKAYNGLAKIFALPTKATLSRMTQKNKFPPGINEDIFNAIKLKVDNFESDLDKYCILTIDEMSIKTNLFYNLSTDEVIGFEDMGNGKQFKPALNVTVFMLRGIHTNWKQPVGYFFIHNSCSATVLQEAIKTIFKYSKNIGLTCVATITDQGSNFNQLSYSLGVTSNKPYFSIDGQNIVFMFDPPHLIKSIRNNLMKYSFVTSDGKFTSWSHISQFYELDKQKHNRYAHKLTDSHINPSSFEKMKVKYATQVLSASVAAGMETHLTYGGLPSEAIGTIECIERFDKLFDIFNSSNFSAAKIYNKPFEDQEYQRVFLEETLEYLSNLKIIDSAGKNHRKQVKCIRGWQITIRGLMELWKNLSNNGYKFILSRRLNQDCLENYFGSIRQQGGNAINPTAIQFLRSFKKLYCMDFLHSDSQNCADDFAVMLTTMQTFTEAHTEADEAEETEIISEKTAIDTDYHSHDIHEQNSLRYICGYLIGKCLKIHSCDICNNFATEHKELDDTSIFSHLKAYEDVTRSTFGKLKMPANTFFIYITSLENIFFANFEKLILKKNCLNLFQKLYESEDFNHPCPNFPRVYLIKLYSRMRLYYTIKFINKNFANNNLEKWKRKTIVWQHV